MDLRARQHLNRGYSDANARGLEVALVPVVMGGIGWLVDRAVGTEPVFTILLAVIGVAGTFVKLWLGYDREMARHEAGAAWGPRTPPQATQPHDVGGNGPASPTDGTMTA